MTSLPYRWSGVRQTSDGADLDAQATVEILPGTTRAIVYESTDALHNGFQVSFPRCADDDLALGFHIVDAHHPFLLAGGVLSDEELEVGALRRGTPNPPNPRVSHAIRMIKDFPVLHNPYLMANLDKQP